MYQTPQIDELAKALASAQAELKPATKSQTNKHFGSKYADLADVVKDSAPVLAKYGLSVVQAPETEYGVGDEKFDVLTTTVYHSSGQHFSFSTPLYMAKRDAQGHGSAITYARRYAYGAALGIVTDEDDDGNAASAPQPTKSRPAPKPAEPTRRQQARGYLQDWVNAGKITKDHAAFLWADYDEASHDSWCEMIGKAAVGAP